MTRFNCRICRHGSRQIELNLTYPVKQDAASNQYKLDIYFFTPAQLKRDSKHYPVSTFLDDLQSYTRFAAPIIPIPKLVDENCDISPLTRIRKIISNASQINDLDSEKLVYELRTLVNAYHVEVRSRSRQLIAGSDNTPEQIFRQQLVTLLEDLDLFLENLRSLHSEFSGGLFSGELRQSLRWADEAISIKTEKELFSIFDALRKHEDFNHITTLIQPRLGDEHHYRKEMGYDSVIETGDEKSGETFLYRQGILKKWSQSAMYLDQTQSAAVAGVDHIMAGAAAATAMTFALFGTFVAGATFSNYSLPWVLLIVGSYVFKDRLKEISRATLSSLLPRFLANRSWHLVDGGAGNKRIGKSRLSASYITPDDLPESVLHQRRTSASPFDRILPADNIIHISKDVSLHNRKLAQNHTRVNSVTEIIRLKIDKWLTEMDDPVKSLNYFSGNGIDKSSFNRVYQIPVIIRLNNGVDSIQMKSIILNRQGIIRTEEQ